MRALALFALLLAAPAMAAPSFDCARATRDAERRICADPALAALDREIARLHALAREAPRLTPEGLRELKAGQRGWIRGRDDCWKADDPRGCILDAHALRIMEIREAHPDARAADDAGISRGPVVFRCEGIEAPLSAGFVTGEHALAILRVGAVFRVLPAAPAASGARYADEGAWFWTRGDEATGSLNGAELRCMLDDRE